MAQEGGLSCAEGIIPERGGGGVTGDAACEVERRACDKMQRREQQQPNLEVSAVLSVT